MNSISTLILSLLLLTLSVLSCPLYEDKYCCNGEEFVNDCFVQSAGKDPILCQHNQCIQQIVFNSAEWQEVNQYVNTTLDSTINEKLLDSGVRLNYGCWDHQRLKQAIKIQLDQSKNYYVKLQLLCDPLGNYAHIYFNVPYIDDEGHVLMPHPEYKAMEYPHLETDILDVFIDENIIISTDTPIVGNDADEHNCIASAGYSWCEQKNKCLKPWEETCVTTTQMGVIGGDRDEHNCIASAGYLWCEEKNKCLRSWEEECVSTTIGAAIGGDRDEHNCIASAGYSWCESKNKCLRSWEEDCTETTGYVMVGDGTDGVSGSMNLLDVRLQRIGIIALFVILGIGIIVYCIGKQKRKENKNGNKNVESHE
eukprot:825460_1